MSFRFNEDARLPEVLHVTPDVFRDERGWFAETYKRSVFEAHGIPGDLQQDNHSCSNQRGVLRGLHYQLREAAQGKLVRCVRGEVFDVAVDIRRGSPRFGRWTSTVLSEENHRMLWIPAGFAHGFCTLAEATEVLYKTTTEYAPTLERGIRWDDPRIGVRWPIEKPILSDKDAHLPLLAEADLDSSSGEVGKF